MERKLNDQSVLIPPKQINGRVSEYINEAILEGMALEKEDRPQSISAWLGLLETPQTKSEVRSQKSGKPKLSTRSNALGRVRRKLSKIPRISLITLFVLYIMYGMTSVQSLPFWIVPVFALGFGAIVWFMFRGLRRVFIVCIILPFFVYGLWAVPLDLSLKKLKQENFSPFHQFLILSGVSLSGLGLGFLVGW